MKEEYPLEKWNWNQEDFDQMGWHDCYIYAISFDDNVMPDIDYIFKWVPSIVKGGYYKFWISPATLIFKKPTKFETSFVLSFVNGLEIADIHKQVKEGVTTYTIEAQEGNLRIQTKEFEQIVRRPPSLQVYQSLPFYERGDICFKTVSEKRYTPDENTLRLRKFNYKLHDLKNEKKGFEQYKDKFEFEELTAKERILKRKEFKSIASKLDLQIIKYEKLISPIGLPLNILK